MKVKDNQNLEEKIEHKGEGERRDRERCTLTISYPISTSTLIRSSPYKGQDMI